MTTLEHKEPDMVPIDFGGMHTSLHYIAHKNLKKFLGLKDGEEKIQEIVQGIVFPDKRLLDMFQVDVIPVYTKTPSSFEFKIDPVKDEFLDPLGNKWGKPKGGFFYDLKESVMKDFTIENLENYEMPDPWDKGIVRGLRKEVLNLYKNTDKALILFCPLVLAGFMESLWFLRGFEQGYMDIASNIKFVEKFFDKYLKFLKSIWDNVLSEIGDLVNIVQIGGDLGTQIGPAINPKIYRSLIKPCHKELVSFIKTKTKAKVYLHSCGSVHWAIPDFIEVGIDILNPVQVSAYNMDSKILKNDFGDSISFWGGGCDSQNILMQGTPKQVEEEVKRRMSDLAPGGGFVFASIHNIQPNVPPENIVAMFETAAKYRAY